MGARVCGVGVSWGHVEDTESVDGHFKSVRQRDGVKYVETSSGTIALSVWRCTHCRALAVTQRGEKPDGKCGKCHT